VIHAAPPVEQLADSAESKNELDLGIGTWGDGPCLPLHIRVRAICSFAAKAVGLRLLFPAYQLDRRRTPAEIHLRSLDCTATVYC